MDDGVAVDLHLWQSRKGLYKFEVSAKVSTKGFCNEILQ
jgi:hypothetical protein